MSLDKFDLLQIDSSSNIEKIFYNQKLLLNAIQPHHRSFSHPELHSDLINDYKLFRKNYLCTDNVTINTCSRCIKIDDHHLKSKCDIFQLQSDSSDQPPVPKPRKSAERRKQNHVFNGDGVGGETKTVCDIKHAQPVNGCVPVQNNSTSNKDSHVITGVSSTPSPNSLNSPSQSNYIDCDRSSQEKFSSSFFFNHNKLSPLQIPIKVKTKNSFRSFLKINKIANHKFLSLRISRNRSNSKKSVISLNDELCYYKPQKPTRTPPPPPILVFRPPAPSPESVSGDEITPNQSLIDVSMSAKHFCPESVQRRPLIESILECDTVSELYHDAMLPEEAIYWTVDEEISNSKKDKFDSNNMYEGVAKVFDEKKIFETNEESDIGNGHYGYYDDSECIYEQLSSNDETLYEEYIDDENLYDNAEIVESEQLQDKKQLKRQKKVHKMMKRFNLNGDEIPINAGIIKENRKGSKQDLLVHKGETVLILRMKDNPPGKWLAKNERSKIGFIDLDNVLFDAESIKAVIKCFHQIQL